MRQTWLRKNLKDWARRNHFDVLAVIRPKSNHHRYLSFCDQLENMTGLDVWGAGQENDLEDAWEIVLQALNMVDEKQLRKLEGYKHE